MSQADLETKMDTRPSSTDDKSSQELAKPVPSRPQQQATLAPDDPENPRLWPMGKKVLTTVTLCFWVLSFNYGSTAYVASIPDLQTRFNISEEVAVLGVSLMIFGLGAGPLLWGPLSEIIGRQKVYRIAALGYTAFSIGVAFSENIGTLIVLRFLAGFFGSASINNVPASIGDYTTLHERLRLTAVYALCAFGGPSIGPLVSAFVDVDAGYRWNLRVIAIFCGVTSIGVAFLPETAGPQLLERKLKRENPELLPPKKSTGENISALVTSMSRPIVFLFTEPVVMIVSLYLSILFGILFGFFEAFTVVWLEIRDWTPTSFGLTYIGLGLGFFFGLGLVGSQGQKQYEKRAAADKARGIPVQPEARLTLAYIGAFLCPAALFIFAWTAPFHQVHWIGPIIGEFLFSFGMILIFTAFIPFLIDNYQLTAASALAAGTAGRAIFGGVFPLFSIQMYHKLTVQGATSLLAGLMCVCAPIPFLFNKYGRTLRAKSKWAVAQEA
uniref:MFS transporter n=1 Tax=Mycena chlorophos TaxID=658473 RepID=A0ABQ0M447_MYCCL|nr:MFS transporter [Mycena chlorophos]